MYLGVVQQMLETDDSRDASIATTDGKEAVTSTVRTLVRFSLISPPASYCGSSSPSEPHRDGAYDWQLGDAIMQFWRLL